MTDLPQVPAREWLVTNGLGGYASGTVTGDITRRYHGLLVAALPAPAGRTMLMPHLSEQIRLADGGTVLLSGARPDIPANDRGEGRCATDFRLETGLPVWRYRVDGIEIEKRVVLPHRQNTVYVIYRLIGGSSLVRIKLLPSVHFRSHNAPVSTPLPTGFQLSSADGRHELSAGPDFPTLRMTLFGPQPAFTLEPQVSQWQYHMEESRGYESRGELWSPGYFRLDMVDGESVALIASVESWETIAAMAPSDVLQAEAERRARLLGDANVPADSALARELVLAADQFMILPVGRTADAARVKAEGDEARTVIAGYHWFTDWGRDTMISLEGLALLTGRVVEAGYILRTFAHYIRNGLIPNLFPEENQEGLYHTADATLWFFHALSRYLAYSGDRAALPLMLPRLKDIIEHHLRGTSFNIGVDPADGLLRQGAEGYQLTWMDAKVGDWVVTPRRGKAVEINALWYNALRLMERWVKSIEGEEAARPFALDAEKVETSFNKRFWFAAGNYLYDVVDGPQGDDSACRPNQIFSLSLDYPLLARDRWEAVLGVVRDRLLTPVGLRTLAPGHPDYCKRYDGDLRARDAAYHQGTVWAWLIGPFVDAWLRVYPDDRGAARELLCGFERHLGEACLGSISEVFDAEAPHTPRGCVAQAWSVAEVLRALAKTRSPEALARKDGGEPPRVSTCKTEER